MGRLEDVRCWLSERFAELAHQHEVPGAAVAVLCENGVAEAATGVLSTRTGVPVTTDSVFQIGSITKIWTTMLTMQLVDEGLLDLDAPVSRYLPGLRVGGGEPDPAITPRRLLCHLEGFEGDVFTPTTLGHDAVERYIDDVFPTIPQLIRPGTLYSYNNAGFVLLGRLIEVLRGRPWAEVLQRHLAEPLGLSDVATRADEAILFRAATGHVRPRPAAPLEPAKEWSLPHSNGPAGAMLAMSARSVLRLAELQLSGGLGPDGTRLVSERSIAATCEHHADVPRAGLRAARWGLGWALYDWPGGPVIGHDGMTVGQAAFLRVAPEEQVAIALLTNGGNAGRLYVDVFTHLFAELAGITVPPPPAPPERPAALGDATRYVGRYEVSSACLDVRAEGEPGAESLVLTHTPKKTAFDGFTAEPDRLRLVPLDGDGATFVATETRDGLHPTYTFVGDDGSGRAAFLHTGRAVPRVKDGLPA